MRRSLESAHPGAAINVALGAAGDAWALKRGDINPRDFAENRAVDAAEGAANAVVGMGAMAAGGMAATAALGTSAGVAAAASAGVAGTAALGALGGMGAARGTSAIGTGVVVSKSCFKRLSSPFGGDSSVREGDLDAATAEVDHRDQCGGGLEAVCAV